MTFYRNSLFGTLLILILSVFLLTGCDPDDKPAGEFLISAWNHLDQHELKAAEIDLKNGIKQHPKNAELRAEYAKIFNLVENGAGAEDNINKAIELGYDKDKAELIFLEALLHQRKMDVMIERIQLAPVMSLIDNEAVRQRLLAQAYLTKRNMAKATEAVQKSLSLNEKDAQALIIKATISANSGQLKEAKDQLNAIIEQQPTQGKAWALLGDIARFEKDLTTAIEAYTKAIENSYNNRKLYFNRAISHLALKEIPLVRKDAKKIAGRNNADLLAKYLNGLADMAEQKTESALARFQEIFAKNEKFPSIHYFLGENSLRLGKPESAANHLRQHIAQSQGNQVNARLLLAIANQQNGDLEGAERSINEVLVTDPENKIALDLKSELLLKQGKGKQAVDLIKGLLANGAASDALYLRLGLSQLLAGEENQAEQALLKAKHLNKGTDQAGALLIFKALQEKNIDKALLLIDELIQQSPDLPLPYSLKGTALIEKQDYVNAEKALLKAWELAPGAEIVGRSLARLSLNKNNQDKAIEWYLAILEKHPNSVVSRVELAQLLLAKKDVQGFELQLKEAMKRNPNDPRPVELLLKGYLSNQQIPKALTLLNHLSKTVQLYDSIKEVGGILYLIGQDYPNALKQFKNLVDKYPNKIQFKIYLAAALRKAGQTDQAIRLLEQAKESAPKDKNVLASLAESYLITKSFAQAQQVISELSSLDDKQISTNMLEGLSAALQKNYTKAAFHFSVVQSKQPNSANLNKYVSMLVKSGQTPKALNDIQDYLVKHNKDIKSWFLLADLQAKTNNHAGAQQSYQAILKLQPNNPLALNNLASELLNSDSKKALELAEKAHAALEDNVSILDTLAWASHLQGDSQRALQLLRQIPEKQQLPEIKVHLKAVLESLGQ